MQIHLTKSSATVGLDPRFHELAAHAHYFCVLAAVNAERDAAAEASEDK